MKGIIIKSRSKEFTVLSEGKEYLCVARGNLKIKDKKLITGDKVTFDNGVISEIEERSVCFVRPHVANIDVVNIVIASTPQPDFLLVDKMIVMAKNRKTEVYITVNKCDITHELANYVVSEYKNAVDNIFAVSAETGEGFEDLKNAMKGKLCCLVGQSAVGKTSLCNILFDISKSVNTISDKTNRGRHTTTSREIHYSQDLFVIDTPGFSALDMTVSSFDLSSFYSDFVPYNGKCFYVGCVHVNEPDCLVKNAVKDGQVSYDRYSRYLTIYKELKEYEKRKY